MILPNPSTAYDPSREAQRNAALSRADAQNIKRGENLEVTRGTHLVMTSPDGNRWKVTIDNTGNLITASL